MSGCLWLTALLLSCLVYVVLLFLCFAVALLSLMISHLNVLYVFHCLLFIFMWFFFIRYRIFLTALPGSFFRVRWINSYQNKKKCMNCLEIYWGLHVLMFAYSHLSAYPQPGFLRHCEAFADHRHCLECAQRPRICLAARAKVLSAC